MTIDNFTIDTNSDEMFRESFGIDMGILMLSSYSKRSEREIKDVVINFAKDLSVWDCNLSPTDMTSTTMFLAPSSFSVEWNQEDEEYWDQYLN